MKQNLVDLTDLDKLFQVVEDMPKVPNTSTTKIITTTTIQATITV